MRKYLLSVLLSLLALFALASSSAAQGLQRADAFQYVTGPCTWKSGTGSPESAVTGKPCDFWIQTDSPYDLWRKYSGTGNTGWLPVTSGSSGAMGGSGTSGRVAYWSGTSTLTSDTDLLFDDSTGLLTTAKLWVTSYAPLIEILPSVIRILSPDFPDEFTSDWFVDGTEGVVRFDAYNEDTSAYIPTKFRGSSFDFAGVLTALELQVQTLVAKEVMATIGGRIVVAPTTYLTADLASGGTTITLKHNSFSNGDRILLRSATQLEWMAIASTAGGSAGAYTYTVTRDLDATGANDWVIGDAAVNTGTTGDGYIDMFSDEGTAAVSGGGGLVGPTLVGVIRTGTTWSDLSPAWVLGNMTGTYGYTSTSCSGSLPCYGFASGSASGANVTVDPTNGFRGRNGTTDRFKLAPDGSGFVANSLFAWDTSGNVTITGNALIGGWEIGTTYIRAAADDVGMSSAVTGGDDCRFWAGDATCASAEFHVTESGALFASSATITGSVTSTSGSIGGCTLASSSITCGTSNDVAVMSSGDATWRFWAGNATASSAPFRVTKTGITHVTTLNAEGNIVMGTGGVFRSGATAYGTANGIWMAYNSGTPQFRVGDPSGNFIRYDGADVEIQGDGYVLSNTEGLHFDAVEDDDQHAVSWGTAGALINGDSSRLRTRGPGSTWAQINLSSSGYIQMWAHITGAGTPTLELGSEGLLPVAGLSLGTEDYVWGEFYVEPGTTTASEYPLVVISQRVRYKTDGTDNASPCDTGSGEFVQDLAVELGIVTGVTCAVPPFVSDVKTLRAEVEELRAMVALLMGMTGVKR